MRVSHDVRANVVQFYFLAIYSRNCRSLFAIYSYLYRKFVAHCGSRKLNCDGSANGSRQVRDTCDDFAIVLRGVLSHKNFGHVQNFRKRSRPVRDSCEDIANPCERFTTVLRLLRELNRKTVANSRMPVRQGLNVIHREICVKAFSAPRILTFGTNVGYDYCWVLCKRESVSCCLSFPLFVNFCLSPFNFSVTDFSAPMRDIQMLCTPSLRVAKYIVGQKTKLLRIICLLFPFSISLFVPSVIHRGNCQIFLMNYCI